MRYSHTKSYCFYPPGVLNVLETTRWRGVLCSENDIIDTSNIFRSNTGT